MSADKQTLSISRDALGQLLPMYAHVNAEGKITGLGASLAKITGDLRDQNLRDVLTIDRPQNKVTMQALVGLAGRRLNVTISAKEGRREPLRAMVSPLEGGAWLFNFSLGNALLEQVAHHALTVSDFSPCDPTVDMLFVIEANTAALRESARLNARLEEARAKAEIQAATDNLTGLYNRRALDRLLGTLTAHDRQERFGLMHLDLDYFKAVNDTYGHAAGDFVLQRVAEILRDEVRRGDVVSRVGGDEFVLLFPDCPDEATLDRIANRMIARLEEPIIYEGIPCRISASIGTTISDFYERATPDKMLADADAALYASKRAGRAQHTIYSPSP